jgi:hypothetical protein
MLASFFKLIGLTAKPARVSGRRRKFLPLIEALEQRELLTASGATAAAVAPAKATSGSVPTENLAAFYEVMALTIAAVQSPSLAADFDTGQDATDLSDQPPAGTTGLYGQAWTDVLNARPLLVEAMILVDEAFQTTNSEQQQQLQAQAANLEAQTSPLLAQAETDYVTLVAQQPQPAPQPTPNPQPQPQPSINAAVVNFCVQNYQQEVGGGQCANLATEALRVAGAEFEFPNYKWGEPVETIVNGKATFYGAVQAGDIIQYRNAQGGLHTAIVDTVDEETGQPVLVFEQDTQWQKDQTGPWLDTNMKEVHLNDRAYQFGAGAEHYPGTITIYQPIPRQNNGRIEFTIVNTTGKSVTVQSTSGPFNLSPFGTGNSFEDRWVKGTTATLTVDGHTITVENNRGYEIVDGPQGLEIVELPQ